jgi:ribulose-bisphosphate carboxylase large chain
VPFSANVPADDHYEMMARGECILERFGPDADEMIFPVTVMSATARRHSPNQYLHYHHRTWRRDLFAVAARP